MATAAGNKNQYNPPTTLTRTSHSVTILVNGTPIGLISGWSPQMSRAVQPIYELNAETSGLPYENIPGNVTGLTISVTRFDLWTAKMEEAFGTVDLTMLSNQQAPFTIQEKWSKPDGSTETYAYTGCWFTSLGRNLRSDDNRLVQVSATLVYLSKNKVA